VNRLLLMILSFISGLYVNENWQEIKTNSRNLYHEVRGTKNQCCPTSGCCDRPKDQNATCGCDKCNGKCGGGKGECDCDPLTCMGVNGCKAWCPGK
jgi:hypothetical protein